MNITIEKYQLAVDQFGDASRFWVTLKDEQGKSKVINVDCSDTVKHIWKINERHELFRAIYPLLKEKIKEKMNKGIRTVDNLPDFTFSSNNIPKYPPNESLSLPDSFSLSNTKASQISQENRLEMFPFKPDSVQQTLSHIFEDGELDTDKQIHDLISQMFEYPEREFYYFHNTTKSLAKKLKSAEKQNVVLLNKVECFYYKHPKHDRDYVKIPGNNPKYDWEKDIIKKGPEFHRHTLKLTQKAKLDLEISYTKFKESQAIVNPFELKPNLFGFGVDLEKMFPLVKKGYLKIKKLIKKDT